jgi:hypothetical protein
MFGGDQIKRSFIGMKAVMKVKTGRRWLRGAWLALVLTLFLLAACAGPVEEEQGGEGEVMATDIVGTTAPGPLVPEMTAEESGGTGGEGGVSNSGGEGEAEANAPGDTAGERFGLPSPEACQELAETLETDIGVPETNVTVEEDSEFTDASTGLASPACQIALSANGAEVEAGASLEEFSNAVSQIFANLGFSQDKPAATAENPNGVAYLMRRDQELASVEIDAQAVEFEDCPEDQPVSECNLPPEQISYSLRVYYSQLVNEEP